MGAVGANVASGSSSTLTYGNDSGAKMPQSIIDFENKRKNAKIEFSILTTENGDVIESNKGGKGSVKSSLAAHYAADILSHNHPVNDKLADNAYGGTFSPRDIDNFMKYSQTTYRAVTKEGTYSITKSEALKNNVYARAEMFKAYDAYEKQIRQESTAVAKELGKQYLSDYDKIVSERNSGKISYNEYKERSSSLYKTYIQKATNESNRGLVALHNWLLGHQKQYGYTYGLIK